MRKNEKIYCNQCGKEIITNEDFLHVEKTWGYFSEKDMETHLFDLCEKCYDEFVKKFKIHTEINEVTEVI